MIGEARVLVYFFIQLSLLLLSGFGFWKAYKAVWYWRAGSGTELQNKIESEQDLLNGILGLVLVSQIALAVYFLTLVNNFAPSLIKGAMCASGVLKASKFGEQVLMAKAASFACVSVFFALESVENRKRSYCATPTKYYFFFLCSIFLVVDTFLGVYFFYGLSPNIITSCCSVDIVISPNIQATLGSQFFWWAVALAWLAFLGMIITKDSWVIGLLGGLSLLGHFFSLKLGFVKYIYGNPMHDCLFDLFLPNHHYLGYLFLGLYMLQFEQLVVFVAKKRFGLEASKSWFLLSAFFLNFIPLAFFVSWQGEF
jgi:hypothetical protein